MIPSLLSFEWSPFAIHSFIHRPDYITITRPGVEIKYCTPLLPGVVTTLRDDCNRTIHCTYIKNKNTNKSSFILSYRSITTIIQCESRLQNNVVPWTPAYKKNKTDKMTRYEMDRRKDAKLRLPLGLNRAIGRPTVCVCACVPCTTCASHGTVDGETSSRAHTSFRRHSDSQTRRGRDSCAFSPHAQYRTKPHFESFVSLHTLPRTFLLVQTPWPAKNFKLIRHST